MVEEPCGICGVPFRVERVIAIAMTDSRTDMGRTCQSCLSYLGERNPERFLSIEEYREALERYPRPMFHSEEGIFGAAHAASWIR
jgi:hypothetical protein